MRSILGLVCFIGILSVPVVFIGCNSTTQEQSAKEKVTPNATLVVDVEGMTCAKGCAPTIEKAFAKKQGVAKCEVSYDEKTATIEYDNGKVSEEDLLAEFPKIGTGTYEAKIKLKN